MEIFRRTPQIYLALTFCLLIQSPSVHSQQYGSGCNTNNEAFATYLVNSRLYNDAITLINRLSIDNCENPDALRYLKGWSHYYLKQLDSAAINLRLVSNNSPMYLKSQFFTAYSLAHLGEIEAAIDITESIPNSTPLLNELRMTQMAGYNLLSRNMEAYKANSGPLTGEFFQFAENQRVLSEIYSSITSFRQKSPVVAGLMSAVVPGSGKIYAGRYGSGVSSFLTVGILGAITWENYRKDGITSPKTILFGSIFALAYSANIYGSVFSIKAYRDDFNDKMDHRILFHLHIPLRNVFN